MIGIMADSHDNVHAVKRAVRLFKDAGCDLVIHAGDIVAPFAAREMEALNCPVKAVFGNCDGEKQGLQKAFSTFGEINEAPLTFTHQDLDFLVMHILTNIEADLSTGRHCVIVYAHTHKPEVDKDGKTLLINPGETGGWVSGKSTVALLDPKTLSVEILPL